MSDANVYRLMGRHSYLVGNHRLGHHSTVMAVWPHFPLQGEKSMLQKHFRVSHWHHSVLLHKHQVSPF